MATCSDWPAGHFPYANLSANSRRRSARKARFVARSPSRMILSTRRRVEPEAYFRRKKDFTARPSACWRRLEKPSPACFWVRLPARRKLARVAYHGADAILLVHVAIFHTTLCATILVQFE